MSVTFDRHGGQRRKIAEAVKAFVEAVKNVPSAVCVTAEGSVITAWIDTWDPDVSRAIFGFAFDINVALEKKLKFEVRWPTDGVVPADLAGEAWRRLDGLAGR